MAAKKKSIVRKPVLSSEAVTAFAEGRSTPAKAKSAKAIAAEEGSSASRFPPSGDIRLTVNMRGDLHMRLKMEAVKRRTTVGEILEDLVDKHVSK